jgi:hypothetical protein
MFNSQSSEEDQPCAYLVQLDLGLRIVRIVTISELGQDATGCAVALTVIDCVLRGSNLRVQLIPAALM